MTCPRCGTSSPRTDHEGTENGSVVWRVLFCKTCHYTWRNNEPAQTIDAAARDHFFDIDTSALDGLPIVLPPRD
ncbi:non-oxidative hydroxyarylic acid decarboxylases subunit D [Hyphococcus sp.]|jgi:rubredoxin|uniref:non-oxidative hydroxyarylic acid decarboxylases subunit D n=1 Tax=Hyphococcus sp. TaxID=2038636 RepID=UPI0035C66B86